MGKIISLDYSAMQEAYIKANRAADQCESYANRIDSKVTQKVSSLRMGNNSNTSQANYFARAKIDSLNHKRNRYRQFAAKVESAKRFAGETDAAVSSYISRASKDFRASHDMKVGVIAEFFAWASTTLLNSTSFGRFLNQMFKKAGALIDGAKRIFKNWYELNGGKYIIKTVLAVIGTVLAVAFLIFVAWPALLTAFAAISAAGLAGLTGAMIWTLVTAAATFVTAVVAVANGVVKSGSNLAAALSFEDDPGWAKRYNSYTSLSEYLRKNNFNLPFMNKISGIAANVIDGVTIVADIINIKELIHNGVNVVRYLKDGGMAKVFNKVHFKSPSGKVTFGTIKHGVKNVIRNAGEFKKLVMKTNYSRIQMPYDNKLKMNQFYKALKKGEKILKTIEKMGDKGIYEPIKDKIKVKITTPIKGVSTSHEYGSRLVHLFEKINRYHKAQKPKYSVNL